jgi:hypothetical protein
MNWHYSQAMPIGRLVHFGAWEHDEFIGAVIFGRGASHSLVKKFGLTQSEGCELVRVALTTHHAPVTQIVAQTLKQLRQTNPGMRLVVSFADPSEGHHGGIYQAGGWVYTGDSSPTTEVLYKGRWCHIRSLYPPSFDVQKRGRNTPEYRHAEQLRATLPTRRAQGKHRYVMPLDKAMRRRITPLALPFPQPAEQVSTVRR